MKNTNSLGKSDLIEEQKEIFVASVGHDLKNPTIAQIRAVELLLNGKFGKLNEGQREILEMVLDSCRYMNSMLSSLLSTYRDTQGVIDLNYQEHSMPELVTQCIEEMIYLAKDKSVNIKVQNNVNNSFFYGDKIQIKRVIMNLLSNGIKYAFKDSTITIRLDLKKEFIQFQLENKSPYISPEKQEEIFAPYVSFAERYKELGIGLGLYTSQKIIEAHAGKIRVESFKDDTNIFTFRIPITKSSGASNTVVF